MDDERVGRVIVKPDKYRHSKGGKGNGNGKRVHGNANDNSVSTEVSNGANDDFTSNYSSGLTCWHCNVEGHSKRNCPGLLNKGGKGSKGGKGGKGNGKGKGKGKKGGKGDQSSKGNTGCFICWGMDHHKQDCPFSDGNCPPETITENKAIQVEKRDTANAANVTNKKAKKAKDTPSNAK